MMSVIPSFDACPAVTVSDFRNNAYQKVQESTSFTAYVYKGPNNTPVQKHKDMTCVCLRNLVFIEGTDAA